MNHDQIINLYAAVKTLPPEAAAWLTSDDLVIRVTALSKELVLSREQEIQLPLLILRLAAQNLPAENFRQETMDVLNADQKLTDNIVDALKEQIFTPIAEPLMKAGIDIDRLRYNAPGAVPLSPISKKTPETPPLPNTANKPFILHEEPSSFPQKNTASVAAPSFIFSPGDTVNPSLQSAPPKVIIERVVHYSPLRTPLAQPAAKTKKRNADVTVPKSKWFT